MLVWVFGGTAVGKRHFIRHSIEHNPEYRGYSPFWIGEGSLSDDELQQVRCDTFNCLIRWQWERERLLALLRETTPDLPQRIILLTVTAATNFERATRREGESPWTQECLADVSRYVKWLVLGLAAYYSLPLTEIVYE